MVWLAAMLLLHFVSAGAAEATSPTNGFRFIDLSAATTISEAFARQFPGLPSGLQTFHAIPFRIGRSVAVTGMESARSGDFFPTDVSIRIESKAKRIHLLHGAMFAEKDGVPMAKLVFHYGDGSEENVRLGYGVHARDWIIPRLEKQPGLLDPNSQIAWAESDDRRGSAFRIFQTAFENPKPEKAIASIGLVSLFSRAAPFILAMTVEGSESALAANRPLFPRKPVRDLRQFPDAVYRSEVSVLVTDAATGAPSTNAVVSLGITDDKETYFFGETKADAHGLCRMPYPRQYAVGLSIWVHATERAPSIISESKTNVVGFAEHYAVALKPGVTVGGIVKDGSGKAVPGAQVIIHKTTKLSPHHYGRVDYDTVLTTDDGKWISRCLPDDLSGFSFQIMHPDYRPALFATAGYAIPPTNSSSTSAIPPRVPLPVTSRTLSNGPRASVNTRKVVTAGPQQMVVFTTNALLARTAESILQPAVFLEGTLFDVAGKPAPSAELIVQGANGERKTVRTDAEGHFQSRVAEQGEAAVIVIRDGSAPMFHRLITGQSMAPLELRLLPPRVLHGRVQDRSQRPVSGARVRLNAWNGTTDLLRFQTVTDDQGNFIWAGAPSDQASLFISKTNFNNTSHSFSGLVDNLVIPISGSPGVYGKVYDAETKKPVELFTVIPGRKYSTGETPIRWERTESARGAGGEYSLRVSSYYFQPEGRVLVEAPGYEPQISPALSGIDSYACDFALKKGKGITGVVVLADGSPVAGAAVLLVERGESGSLNPGGQLRGNGGSSDLVRSDAKGHFEFTPKLEPASVFVSHEQGFAEAKVADVAKAGKITLHKWGRVKGFMRVGEAGETDAAVQLQGSSEQTPDTDGRFTGLSFALRIDPDASGEFDFEKVPPGEHRLAVEYRFKDDRDGNPPLSHGFPVLVKPGEITKATLGGTGRRVTGRVKLLGGEQSDVDWRRDVHRLALVLPGDAAPPGNGPTLVQTALAFLGGFNSAAPQAMTVEAMRARQRAERTYVLLFGTNGDFRVDNVPSGEYILTLNVTDPEDEYYNRRTMGSLSKQIAVPNESSAKLNALFDIGTLELTIHPRVKLGMSVPSFEMKTSDGKTVQLSDFRGRPLLLHFWGSSLGWSSYDVQVLKEFQSSYGTAGKLAILGCNLDMNPQNAEQFANNQGMTWPQTYLGDWSQSPIAAMFGVNGNSASVLIDAEGKLASGQLRNAPLRTALVNALSAE